MVSLVIGLLASALTLYLALIYASAALALLASAQALLLVSAFIFLCWLQRRVDASVQIPVAAAERGGEVSVQITAANRSRIPCMRIRYRIRMGSTFLAGSRRSWQRGAAVYPGENRYQAAVCLKYAGSYVIGLDRMRIYDLTGLFYMDKRIRRSAGVLVLPEAKSVGVRITERTRNFFGDSDVYDDFHPGDDRSEIFGIREFREGDKIQSIHWKLSAKSDELVVREDSLPLACPVVLILEGGPHRELQEAENYLSTAASIVFSLMDAHCPHFVAWYSGGRRDMVRVRVDDEEGYYLFLTSYLEDSHDMEKTMAGKASAEKMREETLYREKYRYDRPLHTLLLRTDLTLWQEGRQVGAVDGRDWEHSVQKLELIL